ncbi:NAD(P)H-dependent oxidoreductase [Vallicoccus soli]|uniref:Flavodoxin family protein n=1 Tax=Vallicoccus soli TaxID=2339232 RepID=A0A3A3YP16_9ACTN|nr:NAD(P)H-dependent oxidoreductase [Vallicoccus soli]RJK93151.1 flavodoxin family protein [Vallicoccus soli]
MSTLLVTAHPDTGSLTHAAAARLRELLGPGGCEVAHLAQEGFDPRFAPSDRADYLSGGRTSPAVVAEQQRLDRAEHVVLVFPVWWWSLPALLKGWVDRVFVAGWAFRVDEDDRVVPGLQRLTMHLLALSGTSEASYARHGYAQAFAAQVEHGIVDYCGMRRGTTAFVHDTESGDRDRVARDVEAAVAAVAAGVRAGRPAGAGRP